LAHRDYIVFQIAQVFHQPKFRHLL